MILDACLDDRQRHSRQQEQRDQYESFVELQRELSDGRKRSSSWGHRVSRQVKTDDRDDYDSPSLPKGITPFDINKVFCPFSGAMGSL